MKRFPLTVLALCLTLTVFFIWTNLTDNFMMVYLRNRRFQFCNRTNYYMLPNNDIIDNMDDEALYKTYSRYINQKQIICCNVSRVGPRNAFGKNICLDNLNQHKHSCLVYSFGSQFQFQFETAIYRRYQCEIHTFDPSMSLEGHTIPKGVNFHLIGLSNKDLDISAPKSLSFEKIKTWKMRTLSTIIQSLQHSKRTIDILKIDVEGSEWLALPQMLQSGVLKNVKQICIEVHFGYRFEQKFKDKKIHNGFSFNTWGNVTLQNQLQILRNLHDYGFRNFMPDPLKGWHAWRNIDTQVEISLVNLDND